MDAPRWLLAAALALASCGPPSAEAREAEAEPLGVVLRVTAGADARSELPLVVLLHGRGDTPERFAETLDGIDVPVRVASLRAPIEEHDGRAWFTFHRGPDVWQRVGADVAREAERAVRTMGAIARAHPTRGLPVVVGFSQGAMLVYTIALDHPEAVALAVPVSGGLVEESLAAPPRPASQAPRIVALHGRADPVIPIEAHRRTVATLRARGVRIELREHASPHWIDAEMRADLHAVIREAVR